MVIMYYNRYSVQIINEQVMGKGTLYMINVESDSANVKETKYHIVYFALKDAIINNKYAPGTMLTERELCDTYNVSRTPVREALRQLANEGMVELVIGRGAFVARPSIENMIETYEIREALEKMAIKLFIMKSGGSLNERLVQIFKEQSIYKDSDPQLFMKKDMEFHYIIAEGARNKQLFNMIKVVYEQVKFLAFSGDNDLKLRNLALANHQAIVNAVLEGDIQKAEQSVVDHVAEIRSYYLSKYMGKM